MIRIAALEVAREGIMIGGTKEGNCLGARVVVVVQDRGVDERFHGRPSGGPAVGGGCGRNFCG